MSRVNIDFSKFSDFEAAKLIFEYFNIDITNKTYIQLMDEVESKYKNLLTNFHKKYGSDFLNKFNTDVDAILLEILLKHLANVYRWNEH
tara:strand:- start:2694 stop:2960 length:267 start_codon:yes stop_codon:yes gene_type:complete